MYSIMLSAFSSLLMQYLLPTYCLLCQNKILVGKNLCPLCIQELPWNHQSCKKCAVPLDLPTNLSLCGKCLHRPPLFYDKAFAAFVYQAPVIQMIGQLKFNQNLIFGSVLSQLLLVFLQRKYQSSELPQAIIPVPIHRQRRIQRGYNQAAELAKPLSRGLNIPIYFDFCKRVRATLPQTMATERERRLNLKNAFEIKTPHQLKYVAIVDDVLTTGSTAMMLSKALRRSGVEKIDVWVVAKTRFLL